MGTTISRVGDTVKEVLDQLAQGIAEAYACMEIDGDAFVLNPDTKEARIYTLIWEPVVGDVTKSINWKEVGEGRNVGIAVEVARAYGSKPKPGQWIGGIHLR